MFKKPSKTESDVQLTLKSLFNELTHVDPTSPDYDKITDQIAKLHKLKSEEDPQQVSPDTAIMVIGNLVGIAMIIGYERANIVTSKALGFIMKLR